MIKKRRIMFLEKILTTTIIALLIAIVPDVGAEEFADPTFPVDVIDKTIGDTSGDVKVESLTALTYGGEVSYYENGGEDYTGSHYGTNYRAVDISFFGCKGKNVYAVEKGTVVNIAEEDGMVFIKHIKPLVLHDDTHIYEEWYTMYAHMKDIKVIINQEIEKNTIIGQISNTNFKNDPKMAIHLHFGITTKLYNENASFHYAYKYAKNKDLLKEYSNATISPYWLKGSFRKVKYSAYKEPQNQIAHDAALLRITQETSYAPKSTYTPQHISIKSGDYINFGKFEQDNDLKNGKEKLLWQVLAVENDKALIVSNKIIDTVTVSGDYSWKGSTLQKWCQNFVNDSTNFSDIEKNIILNTKLSDTGTTDKMFFLSSSEISKYWKDINDRLTVTTDHTPSNMSISDYSGPDDELKETMNNMNLNTYWLRSSLSSYWIEIAYGSDGGFGTCINLNMADSTWGVRPACYIDISDLKFSYKNDGTLNSPYTIISVETNQPSDATVKSISEKLTSEKYTNSEIMINSKEMTFDTYNINKIAETLSGILMKLLISK
jgi:murein DD-endopeptidase MepM/ murein hydrolase activator NlpD